MTVTIEGVDTDTIDMLDFDHAIQCEAIDENDIQCENEAQHIIRRRCCKQEFFICSDCYTDWKEYVSHVDIFVCFICDAQFFFEDPMEYLGRIN